MKSLGIWGPLALLLSFAACSTIQTGPHYPAKNNTNLTPAQEQALEERILKSAREFRAQSQVNYKVQPGDLLEINVYQEKDMARTVRVSGNGTITFPLAGNIKLSDLSVPEAEAVLAQALGEYIINPQVTVLIKEYSNKQVYVLGEVKKPGSITLPVERRLTVLEAITLAGGFTDLAAQDKTKVLRNANGQNLTIEVEISKITKQGDKSADIFLEPNDTVFVPQSFF